MDETEEKEVGEEEDVGSEVDRRGDFPLMDPCAWAVGALDVDSRRASFVSRSRSGSNALK